MTTDISAAKFIEQYFSTTEGEECDTVERMSQVAKKLVDPISDHGNTPLTLLSDELVKVRFTFISALFFVIFLDFEGVFIEIKNVLKIKYFCSLFRLLIFRRPYQPSSFHIRVWLVR